jgi:hypothetical protein
VLRGEQFPTQILPIISIHSCVNYIDLELPAFADYFKQLKDADAPYASQCMAHWKLFLEGPPNKPNEDEFGLIEVRELSTFSSSLFIVCNVWYGRLSVDSSRRVRMALCPQRL